MNPRPLAAALGLCLLLPGCTPEPPPDPEEPADTGSLLLSEQGLRLPAESRAALGIETSPATSRELHPRLDVTAQVFARTTNDAGQIFALASALFPVTDTQLSPTQTITFNTGASAQPAEITRVDSEVQSAYGHSEVILRVPDPTGTWTPGGFAEAQITLPPRQAAVAVPQPAVVRAALGDFVYLSSGEFLKRVRVKVGASDAAWTEILEGLPAGQAVVTQGAEALWLLELSEAGGMTNIH